MKRLALLLLTLAACTSPTAPVDPSCTLTAVVWGIRIRSCYEVCPADAKQFALDHGETFATGYSCPRVAP